MFNISLKGYSTQKGVSGGASVFKIRPCYGKKSSVNENRISYLQIDETVSTGLNNHRGGAPNTKQTEIMVRNLFETFILPIQSSQYFQFRKLLRNSMNLQIDRSIDRGTDR